MKILRGTAAVTEEQLLKSHCGKSMGRQEFVSILEPEDLPEDEVAQANGQFGRCSGACCLKRYYCGLLRFLRRKRAFFYD